MNTYKSMYVRVYVYVKAPLKVGVAGGWVKGLFCAATAGETKTDKKGEGPGGRPANTRTEITQ